MPSCWPLGDRRTFRRFRSDNRHKLRCRLFVNPPVMIRLGPSDLLGIGSRLGEFRRIAGPLNRLCRRFAADATEYTTAPASRQQTVKKTRSRPPERPVWGCCRDFCGEESDLREADIKGTRREVRSGNFSAHRAPNSDCGLGGRKPSGNGDASSRITFSPSKTGENLVKNHCIPPDKRHAMYEIWCVVH